MNQPGIQFLDLPDEILLTILKKLDNVDVLYSLLGINNERLDNLAQETIFSNTLKFVSTSLNEDNSSIPDSILDRLCTYALPRVRHNVTRLILESISMERIILAADFPNLTSLKLFNFGQEIVARYFTDRSSLQHIFKQQITDLTLVNSDSYTIKKSSRLYTINVYVHILFFFTNLKYLTIISSSNIIYPGLSLRRLPSIFFSSSTLVKLCITVNTFDDCLYLLDGRLQQLATFIVQIHNIDKDSLITHNMDDLPNLKCFSLMCYGRISKYDNRIVPLLRRMSYLKKLTLYLRIANRFIFIDETHLQNEIIVHMPRLHTFMFYICTDNDIDDSVDYLFSDDIRRTFINIEEQQQQQVISIVNYFEEISAVCHVFSVPFTFDRLYKIGNVFPSIVFNYVTYLTTFDVVPFKHEFFIRIAQAFPVLKYLEIRNVDSQSSNIDNFQSDNCELYTIAEYFHLTSLDIRFVDIDYVEQFLLETKSYLPCLTQLRASYDELATVTKNFTRDETRRNCANVKSFIDGKPLVYSKEFYLYFPLL